MKNLKKNFLFVFIGTFFACESDDDLKLINPSILGTWKLTSLLENGIEQFENGDCDEFLIFKDLTFQLKYFDDENCIMEKLEGPISYALIGDTIKYIDDENEVSLEIVDLTLSTLKLKEVYEENGEIFSNISTYTRPMI